MGNNQDNNWGDEYGDGAYKLHSRNKSLFHLYEQVQLLQLTFVTFNEVVI